jgi:hypothetical protein
LRPFHQPTCALTDPATTPTTRSARQEKTNAQALHPDRSTRRRQTTLAHALRQRGYRVVDEAATDVITTHQAHGVDQPWQRSTS